MKSLLLKSRNIYKLLVLLILSTLVFLDEVLNLEHNLLLHAAELFLMSYCAILIMHSSMGKFYKLCWGAFLLLLVFRLLLNPNVPLSVFVYELFN